MVFRLGKLLPAAQGAGPHPRGLAHRPHGARQPAHGRARRAAAGRDHPGQREREGERGRLLPGGGPGEARWCRSRTTSTPPARRRRRPCAASSARPTSTSCSPSASGWARVLQEVIDEHTDPWGVKVPQVAVKAVDLPQEMQRAMARQAESEREKRAKIIHASGELEASRQLTEAAQALHAEPSRRPPALPADPDRDRGREELDHHLSRSHRLHAGVHARGEARSRA